MMLAADSALATGATEKSSQLQWLSTMAASSRRKRSRKQKKQPAVGGNPDTKKRPRLPFHPEASKIPSAANRRDFGRYHPRWRFGLLEFGGPFGWNALGPEVAPTLHKRLKQLEKKTWNEIFVGDRYWHHSASRDKLCAKADRRLKQLKLDDHERLWSLHITAEQRVWGILVEDVFYLLWWDPEHEVYPYHLKGT